MNDRLQKKDVVRRVAARMKTDEAIAEIWVDMMLDTLCEAFKAGKSVTLTGFGGFYVRPRREAWIFKFNPGQKLRKIFRWSSTYKGDL